MSEKLIRDLIPNFIIDNRYRIRSAVNDTEFKRFLVEKLYEEVTEFVSSDDVHELADVLEVIDALAEFYRLTPEELRLLQVAKRNERGAFKKRLIIELTT